MLIDWFTVGAQTLNFLVLVWLMKRFLYKPILDAIDAREQRIAAELADADAKRDEAQMERDKFQHKNEEFDQQRAALLSQANDEVTSERQRLLDEARAAANDLRDKGREALRREQQSLAAEITRRTREEVFAIARKTLTDLAAASLEERMSDVFTCRVRELDGEAKDGFANALRSSSMPAVVRSTFELPAEQRAAIQLAINETFAADIELSFQAAPTVISGIELSANGHKVCWSIAEYLMSLERSVDELLDEQSQPQVELADKPDSQNE
jgi:F-type H+-transporting ATPase subunit b